MDPAEQDKGWRWRSRRVLLIGIVVLALVGGGGTYVLTHRASAAEQPAVRTVAASLGTMQQTVSATGTIEPATQADLSFQTSGTVQTLTATVGQKVAKGARLATINDTSLQSTVTLAQAQLVQAQAQATDTASSGTATQIASANAQLASAQAKLDAATAALSQATLISPITGTVAAVTIQVGSTVSGTSGSGGSGSGGSGGFAAGGSGGSASSASSSSSSGDITVISTDAWIVSTQVTNSSLPSLKPGLQVQITPAGSSTPLFGTVQSIGIVATSSSSGAAQFPVTVAVTGTPTGLYAGTTASVSIIVKQLTNVLTVPTLAVRTANGKTVVTVRSNGVDTTTPVTVGQVFGAQTQITAGIAAGAEVVLPTSLGPRTGTGGTGGAGTRGTGGTGGFGGFGGNGGFGGTSGFGGGSRTGGGTTNGN